MQPINYLSISIPDVFQRVGTIERTHVSQNDIRPRRPFDAKQYGLLAYWPRSLAWLTIQLRAGEPGVDFKDGHEGLSEVCLAHGADANHVAPAKFLQTHSYQVASVNRDAPITLSIRIDTDHEGFRQAVLAQPGAVVREEFLLPINLLFFDAKHLGVYFNQEGTLTLSLKPAKSVPSYDGFAALDLGNTSSTLVGLSLSDAFYRTDAMKLVHADAPRGEWRAHVDAVVSHVRIDRIRSYEPPPPGVRRFPSVLKDDYPQTVNWVAGRLASPQDNASGSGTTGLVLGAKRLIAGKDWERTQKLVCLHRHTYQKTEQTEQVEILNRLPAELLVCRMLQRFREAAQAWPRALAITYPTTYSPRELEQLIEVVQRAWLRMQSRSQSVETAESEADESEPVLTKDCFTLQQIIHSRRLGNEPPDDPIIRLLVDEATAAAFFFLYRRIFEEPGGLPRFCYLYPNGLNMLLYDCGGGTTDIALVRAFIDPDAADVLRIKVLARSGLRGFGGDDITRAAARLLKAKLAVKVAEARGRPLKVNWPMLPTGPTADRSKLAPLTKALEEAIAKVKEFDPRDELVPTTFDFNQMDDSSNQRRDCAFDLWRWAEMLKLRLEKSEAAAFLRIDRNLNRLSAAMLKGLSDVQAQQLVGQIEKITLQRWEIDALIDALVDKSIRNCNNLIRDHLVNNREDQQEEEVHWVVASGNASRYPLIQESLRRKLHVPFIDDGRFTLDENNLKHAVAKGAVLALSTISAMGMVRIEFDSDLSNCLPYDVGYKDLRRNTYPYLYREHTRYDKLERRTVPIVAIRGSSGPSHRRLEKFVMDRRFPGDDSFVPFLVFHFPDGIQGDLEVSYDAQLREFSVRDLVTGVVGELTDVTDASMYRSPAQRGDL
jgi:molecular chaperone DnaK (HSP70)